MNKPQTFTEQFQERVLNIPKVLFPNQNNALVSIADETYFYAQKSSYYTFQRQTYSTYKGRNLLKIMLLASTDRYIIEAFGQEPATNSDATILFIGKIISKREKSKIFRPRFPRRDWSND